MLTRKQIDLILEEEFEGYPEKYQEKNLLRLSMIVRANRTELQQNSVGQCYEAVVEYKTRWQSST